MNLQQGIKLILNNSNIDEKVFINNGVNLAPIKLNSKSIHYDSDAYIPNHNWKILSNIEKEILISKNDKDSYATSILLQKLPNEIISLIEKLNINNCKDYPSVLNAFSENAVTVEIIQEQINEILFQYSKVNNQLEFHRIVFNPPQIETLTYYIENKKLNFVGLHIDRSTVFDFTNVESSKNRLCINICNEDRIVYFVNLSLNQMLLILKDVAKVDISNISVNNVGFHFFQQFPNYPVIKIIQSPYEYYIMPTDNVLHDGSSLGKSNHDICLVYLGYFNTNIK